MPDNGNYVLLDLSSVRKDATKTSTFIQNKLGGKTSLQNHVVVFLGETHGNRIDGDVTQAILAAPPIVDHTNMRLIYERGLQNNYVAGILFTSEKTETSALDLTRKARSRVIADMIIDAFENNIPAVYVACGAQHGQEVFDSMNKRCPVKFTYIEKPSCA